MVAVVLEHSVARIFHLPARTPRLDDWLNRGGSEVIVGGKGIVVELLTAIFPADGQLRPIHQQSIRTRAERNVVDPTIGPDFGKSPIPVAAGQAGQLSV